MNTPLADLVGGSQLPPGAAIGHAARPGSADAAKHIAQPPSFPTFASLVTRILSGQPANAPSDAEVQAEPSTEESESSTDVVASNAAHEPPAEAALDALRSFVERLAAPADAPKSDVPATNVAEEAAAPVATTSRREAKTAADAIRHHANTDPSFIVRDLSVLAPELQARVERVIDRMQEEFGHKVTVVETWRSQSRQDVLFEQGRSVPGHVVTWVKHSTHSDGRAADLLIDGRWTNPAAYRRMQQIAAEEGLRTLGTRDPGHVELRKPAAAIASAAGSDHQPSPKANPIVGVAQSPKAHATGKTFADATIAAGVKITGAARIVEGAAGAEIVRVNDVARSLSAQRADRKGSSSPESAPAQQPDADDHSGAHAARAPQASGESADRVTPAAASRSTWRPERRRNTVPTDAAPSTPARPSVPPTSQAQPSARSFTPSRVGLAADVSPAMRMDRIATLKDLADSQPMSGLILRIDAPEGGVDRIRLGVQGTQVAAQIDVADSARAISLGERVPELLRALESRGFETSAVHVRSAAAVSAPPSAGAGNDAGPRSDSRSSQDDSPFRSPYNPFRQRSRREREGGNQ